LQAPQGAFGQLQFELVGLFPDALQRASGADSVQPAHERRHRLLDFGHGGFRRFIALLHVLIDDLLQVVDGVQIHILEARDLRFDVPRDRDVNQKHRSMPPFAQRRFHVALADHRL
jgi:hypothetical protein